MGYVVTGFSSNGDIAGVRAALASAGLPTDTLAVITADEATPSLAEGAAGADLFTSDRGASIPGLGPRGGGVPFFRNEGLSDRLGDLEIPESELDNYCEAVARGTSIVYYFAAANTVDRALQIFTARGDLKNVRRF